MTDTNLNRAKKMLTENGYTCVFVSDDNIISSYERGVKPLLALLDKEENVLVSYCGADKVVGRAAAFLYVLLGIKELYAAIISDGACEVLNRYGISFTYGTRVKRIINRSGDGFCPMESCTLECTEPSEALNEIRNTLLIINKNR